MFLPPKLIVIALNTLAIGLLFVGSADAQQAEFNRRIAAMQEARARAQQAPNVRVASNDIGADYSAPPTPPGVQRVAMAPQQRTATRAPANRQVVLAQTNQPQRMAQRPQQRSQIASRVGAPVARTAQLMDSTFVDGGSPIISSSPGYNSPGCTSPGCTSPGCTSCGSSSIGGGIEQGGFIDGGYSSCESCGDAGAYFSECDECCDRGGCPPGPCWLTGFGALLYNGDYFIGATSFQSTLFATPGIDANSLSDDCSFGFYGGANFGVPLCKLTCGVFSGQFGIRSVNTNFNGNEFSADSRDQLFVTAGFYRRVDYGLQVGVVADILHEEWFTEADLVQIRADLGWVYPGGTTFGFRSANNVQDDVNSGTFGGNNFNNLVQSTEDQYRFYCRRESAAGGFGEGFLGWSGNSQTVFGLDFDMPLTDRVAMQSGFAYFLGDEGLPAGTGRAGGNADDAYNIYVGLALRPRGRSHYKSYDRPLFSVADNGSMLITRQ